MTNTRRAIVSVGARTDRESARRSGRDVRLTGHVAPPSRTPFRVPSRRIAATIAATVAVLLSLVGALPVLAATPPTSVSVTTPYPAVSVTPGSKASFDLTVATDQPSRVDLAVT